MAASSELNNRVFAHLERHDLLAEDRVTSARHVLQRRPHQLVCKLAQSRLQLIGVGHTDAVQKSAEHATV